MNNTIMKRDEIAIIVVDDMKFNCEFVRKSLETEGYGDIRTAMSAAETLSLLEQRRADVVIADWEMPEMDGLALVDQIRQLDEERHHYTALLLLTGRDDTDSMIEAFDRGVDDYLTKPPNKQELASRVYAAGRIANLQNGLLDAVDGLRDNYEARVTIDQATGLGNRLEAERRLNELLKVVESRGGATCCAFFSINNSKKLMEKLGERVYCEILKSVAVRLSRVIRPNDLATRISDSEFVIGMYYLDEDQIRVKTFKRIMQAVNLRPIKTSHGFITITGAMAVSCSRKGVLYGSAEELMETAAHKIKLSLASGSNEVAM